MVNGKWQIHRLRRRRTYRHSSRRISSCACLSGIDTSQPRDFRQENKKQNTKDNTGKKEKKNKDTSDLNGRQKSRREGNSGFPPPPMGQSATLLSTRALEKRPAHQGVVSVETHTQLPKRRQQLLLHVSRDCVVHPLVDRRRLPPLGPEQTDSKRHDIVLLFMWWKNRNNPRMLDESTMLALTTDNLSCRQKMFAVFQIHSSSRCAPTN